METREIYIDTGDLARFIAWAIIIIAWLAIAVYPWFSYFFLEESDAIALGGNDPMTGMREFSIAVWIITIVIFLIAAFSGTWDYQTLTITIPVIAMSKKDKHDDEMIELLMKAASLLGEGRTKEADALYDKIEEIKRRT